MSVEISRSQWDLASGELDKTVVSVIDDSVVELPDDSPTLLYPNR
jgi:hypothetical protein